MAQKEHLKDVVVGLLVVEAVRSAILGWWNFLTVLVLKNSKKPLSSKHGLEYEKARIKTRSQKQKDFSHNPAIFDAAVKLGVE